MRWITSPWIAAMLIALVTGCVGSQDNQDSSQPTPVVAVRVVPVVRGSLDVTLQAYGETNVLDREDIVSPIDGTITYMNAEVGRRVKDGDTLAVIRTRDSEASIAGAMRLVNEATDAQQKAQAKRAMEVAIESQQLVPIIAHRPGDVVAKMVSDKQTVTANTILLQLVDLSTLDFVANVPLQEIPQVKVGQQCRIEFPYLPNTRFDGKVAAVSAQSMSGSQATVVRIAFETPLKEIEADLRIGMMGTANIITGVHSDVLLVPRSALLRDDINDTYTIYTVNSDSLAIATPVTVGVVGDSLAEISAPSLTVGQPIIVQGNYEVNDSTRVTVQNGSNQ